MKSPKYLTLLIITLLLMQYGQILNSTSNDLEYVVFFYGSDLKVDNFTLRFTKINDRVIANIFREPKNVNDPLYQYLIKALEISNYTFNLNNYLTLDLTPYPKLPFYIDIKTLRTLLDTLSSCNVSILNITGITELSNHTYLKVINVSYDDLNAVFEVFNVKDGYLISKTIYKMVFSSSGWLKRFSRIKCYLIDSDILLCGGIDPENVDVVHVSELSNDFKSLIEQSITNLLDWVKDGNYVVYEVLWSVRSNTDELRALSYIASEIHVTNATITRTYTVVLRGGELGIIEEPTIIRVPSIRIYGRLVESNLSPIFSGLLTLIRLMTKPLISLRINTTYGTLIKESTPDYGYSEILLLDPITVVGCSCSQAVISNWTLLNYLGLRISNRVITMGNGTYIELGTLSGVDANGSYRATYDVNGWLVNLELKYAGTIRSNYVDLTVDELKIVVRALGSNFLSSIPSSNETLLNLLKNYKEDYIPYEVIIAILSIPSITIITYVYVKKRGSKHTRIHSRRS